MQVVETKSEGLSREFKVTVEAKDIEEKIDLRISEIAKQASLPGFRPGKAPASLLRKRFGDAVRGEVLEQAVNDSSTQAMAEKGLRPAAQPDIEIVSFESGGDLEYTIAIDILPEIEPMDFSTLTVDKMVMKRDEKAIDEALQNIADSNKSSEPIKRKRKTKAGDIVVIDFVGKVDGEEFPGGKAESYQLELGSNMFIPGFEDQLIGKNADDDVEVNVKFPDEYGAQDLAGKDAVFECKIHEIRETAPAAIDDELAKKVGSETLDGLKDRIAEEQSKQFDEMARMLVKRKILDELGDKHEFETPAKMVDGEFESIWSQYEAEKKAHDESDDQDDDHDDRPEEDQKAEFREIAIRRVKLGLLLSEVGRRNAITVGPDEVNRAMVQEAQKYPGQEQQILEYFRGNPQAQEALKAPIYEEKVIDFILELAKVNETEATFEDLTAAISAQNDKDEGETAKPAKKKAAAKKTPAKKPAAKKKAAAKKDAEPEDGEADEG